MKILLDANICLDLLDTSRQTSKRSVEWYLANKDNEEYEFFFSGDFITTFYYVLTEKRKYDPKATLLAIEALSEKIIPHYIAHNDFVNAKEAFFNNQCEDFEDLLILSSASRIDAKLFITNDKKLLQLGKFQNIEIVAP